MFHFISFHFSVTHKNLEIKTGACNFIKKETLAQVFSCEFCEISKNTFFYKTPLVAASNAQEDNWIMLP